MALPFRRRLFLGLVAIGTLPLAAALVVLAAQLRASGSPAGPRAAMEDIAESSRQLIGALDTASLTPSARATLDNHVRTITQRTTLARRAETITATAAATLAVIVFAAAAVIVALSVWLARRWSTTISAPVVELVDWVRRIQHDQPLPETALGDHTPEFSALRDALRDMATHLDRARRESIERERLLAFRETARRVAHEIRGPLTAMRLATGQLADGSSPGALEVLHEETRRLDHLAREFAEFGRLPEGPTSPIDVAGLLRAVADTTIPANTPVRWELEAGLEVSARYEPLRRAIQNVLRNAVEASPEDEIDVAARADGGRVVITITDHGPGIPAEDADRVFQPYHTTKPSGTGLGLAIARQAIESHRGDIRVERAAGGGAAIVITLPVEVS